tara:strand:- start:351 stop:626 length:276 start_codon:yes stop_codon:yes gene_type:complete
MKITIIIEDKDIYKDKISFKISNCDEAPENVKVLQFDNSVNVGHIEFSNAPNEVITELPDWANTLITRHDSELEDYKKVQAELLKNRTNRS